MKIVISGGSIAGLSSALTLSCIGHDVHVYERSEVPLRGRGGGVAVLRHMMKFLEQHGHYTQQMISVPTIMRRRIDINGNVLSEEPEKLPFSSWDTVYPSLCAMLSKDRISYGQEVINFTEHDEVIEIDFDRGESVSADILVAADGIGSRARAKLFPDYESRFAGYVAWRGIVDESAFSPVEIEALVNNFTMFREPGHMFMAFLIPGLDGSLEPGGRRFNWLWYRNETDEAAMHRHLTDKHGHRHHASISPGHLSTESFAELCELATRYLPVTFQQLVRETQAPFFQSIFDALSPGFSVGRVALIGDAACTVRPHTASGTSKAADDAVALAEALSSNSELHVEQVLALWAARRRDEVGRLLAKGPELAASFGLGNTDDRR
ncbi:2-polyprenyl-6-methoxyphenol hydroxylase-like FAD-dependent oxidoreductase [Paraburkholderia sp. BL23I1N1]|uniref:FAD binding domain-containing protein n=1 Tax=Paraburkholderia sp. BL23I1N1 TaxID=1938802 RepID=UPI000E728AF6|nr:FAD-dependent monooxygenase [Paraburkholderia sp. BL23I1N1]RKE39941.1 2-polyprenyl-6-methoxyphenol hydroxylase-like FAD-dependent oxidoreductase [Paraburkholderia sp. BL23I1N1]